MSSIEISLRFTIFFILIVEFTSHFCLLQEKQSKIVNFVTEDHGYEIKGK